MHSAQKTDWEEVFHTWKEQEDNPTWQEHYQKKGLRNWEDWRWPRVKLFGLADRTWHLEKPDNSVQEVRAMYCDATTPCRKFYKDRLKSTFADLKDHPFFQHHERVLDIRENFPVDSQLIALRSGEQSIIFDGHHRAVALAGMPETSEAPTVNIAVTDYAQSERRAFERIFNAPFTLRIERKILNVIAVMRSRMNAVAR